MNSINVSNHTRQRSKCFSAVTTFLRVIDIYMIDSIGFFTNEIKRLLNTYILSKLRNLCCLITTCSRSKSWRTCPNHQNRSKWTLSSRNPMLKFESMRVYSTIFYLGMTDSTIKRKWMPFRENCQIKMQRTHFYTAEFDAEYSIGLWCSFGCWH